MVKKDTTVRMHTVALTIVYRDPVAVNLGDTIRDALEVDRAGAADHADHLVALLQQKLGQVAAILAGNAGDQRAFLFRHLLWCSLLCDSTLSLYQKHSRLSAK